MARIVVVGGGVAGLASAARLSIKGHDVAILEQSDRLGGLVRSYTRDGFTFELGPSKLTLPAVYRDLFLKTGASLEDSIDLVEIPDGTRYYWPGGARGRDFGPETSVLLPSVGGTAAARELDSVLGGSTGEDWRTLTKRAAQMWKIVRPQLVEQQLADYADLKAVTAERDARKTLAPRSSLRKITKKLVKDPHVRQLVESYALLQGADPRTAPATYLTLPYIEQTFGTWWIGGGIHKLVDALEDRCLERGVEIRRNARVADIMTSESKVTGITLQDGSTLEADIIVWSGSTRNLAEACSDQALQSMEETANQVKPTHSMLTIMVALKGTTAGLAHDNVYLSRDPNKELRRLQAGLQTWEPTIRVSVAADQTMQPQGHEALTIQVPAPLHRPLGHHANYRGLDWSEPELAKATATLTIAQLGGHGLNLAERELWHEVRTPADIEAETGSPGGAIYGSAPDGWQRTWLKPTIHTAVEGLYLVGDSAQPGAGLDRVGMGAEILAETIGRAKRRARRKPANDQGST